MSHSTVEQRSVVLHAGYKDIVGGHVAYEFVTTDDAMCGRREIIGYPKKFADGQILPAI
jgi:acetoacetate decarboxylase